MRPPGDAQLLEQRRKQAVALVKDGHTAAQAAKAVSTTLRSVRRWLRAHRERGSSGLAARPVTGRPPKLTPGQGEELMRMLRRGPRANEFRGDRWEDWTIARLIQREFSVVFHPDYVLRLLRRISGLTLDELNRRPWVER
jgi:transposase